MRLVGPVRQLAVKLGVQAGTVHRLHRANPVDRLGQGVVGDGIGLMRRHEGRAGLCQPQHSHDKKHWQHHQHERRELPIEPEHHADDADQQRNVAHRLHRGLEEFLHRVHVALKPRHQPPDLGLVHERKRDVLQVAEHLAADVEEDILGHLPGHPLLHERCCVFDRAGDSEQRVDHRLNPAGRPRGHAVVNGVADQERDGQLRQGKDQHRSDRDPDPAPVGGDEFPDAADHLAVEDPAEDVIVDPVGTHHRPHPGPADVVGLAGLARPGGALFGASLSITSASGCICRSCSAL